MVRRARPARRRAAWRLGLLGLGAAVLVWQVLRPLPLGAVPDQRLVAAAVVVALLGVLAVLPWLVDVVVARLGSGPLPWQLAVRRLQSGGATSGRAASGVAVAVTGLIALQVLSAGLGAAYASATGADPSRADAAVQSSGVPGALAAATAAALAGAPGVEDVRATTWVSAAADDPAVGAQLVVGDCEALAEVADLPSCTDGDVFTTDVAGDLRGRPLQLGASAPGLWTVPAAAVAVASRPDPAGDEVSGAVLATPAALDVRAVDGAGLRAFVRTDTGDPQALAGLVRAATGSDPLAAVRVLTATEVSSRLTAVRRGLLAGAVVVLLAVGLTLLVSASEQVRERAAVLSALAAVGMRRSTAAASLLLEAAVPVLLGTGLALLAGCGLGALLLVVAGLPPVWVPGAAAATAGGAAAVLLLVTALALPGLRRAMRPLAARVE